MSDRPADKPSYEELERDLLVQRQRCKAIRAGARDGLWEWDIKRDTLTLSDRWCEMLGYTAAEIGSSSAAWFSLVDPRDVDRLHFEMDLHLRGVTPSMEVEYRMHHRDGHEIWMFVRGVALREDDKPVRMAGSQTDVTDLKRKEENYFQGTFYDSLTSLANRSLFLDRLAFLVNRGKRGSGHPFVVLLLDIDRFKVLNQRFGQSACDALLVAVARRLERHIGASNTIARIGGDEFGLIIDGAEKLVVGIHEAERMIAELKEPIDIGIEEVELTLSVGAVFNDGHYASADDVLRDAGSAMYRAQSKGGDRFEIFDERMNLEAVALLKIESALRRGIADNQFKLYYQPIIDLADGAIAGCEALLRWEHPEHGLVMPDEFIGVAEHSGLIVPLGEWVVHEACRQSRAWQDDGLDPHSIAVNISARQFAVGNVEQLVQEALDAYSLPGSSLQVELTETVVMEEPEGALQIIRALEAMGVQLVMDDFGTGYSSLAYLKKFRFGSLKIDRSFVQDMTEDAETAALVAAVIGLSHSFRSECVGEGVETAEQLSYLRLLNCDKAQGFLFSRPLPADDFAELLRTGIKGWHSLLF